MIKVRKNTINKAKLLSKRAFFCIIVSQNRKINSKLLIITKKADIIIYYAANTALTVECTENFFGRKTFLEDEKMIKEPGQETAEEKKKHIKSEIIDWIKTLFFFCVLPVAIFECFCFIARVPTGSMETTVPTGSQVLVTRCYNKDNIQRGDVVVFYSDELGLTLFKRCIGIPGDMIEFDGTGAVYINGEYYDEPYVSSYSDFEGTFYVPEDCYFFCGDNRAGSGDARMWKNPYISKEKVQGKARFIFFPFTSIGVIK